VVIWQAAFYTPNTYSHVRKARMLHLEHSHQKLDTRLGSFGHAHDHKSTEYCLPRLFFDVFMDVCTTSARAIEALL
jgi:hypothetical protein